jgi:sensory rhodopsin
MMDMVTITQYTFLVAFVGMSGGTLYFLLMKPTVPIAYQSSVATSAVYCFVAAVVYGYMNFKYGIGTDLLAKGQYPTELRYVDWLITTPLIVLKFPELLQGSKSNVAVAGAIVVADFMMILFGFAGETSINAAKGATLVGWTMFGMSMLAWLFIIVILYTSVTQASQDKLEPIKIGLTRLKLFIAIGWAIYPLGYLVTLLSPSPEVRLARELIYNFADLFNKVGFGMVALFAIQQMLREAQIRQAMQSL